jgi:hypothetical protein
LDRHGRRSTGSVQRADSLARAGARKPERWPGPPAARSFLAFVSLLPPVNGLARHSSKIRFKLFFLSWGFLHIPAKRFNSGFRVDSRMSLYYHFLSVFIDHMHVGEVQINGGSSEALVAENLLNGGQRGTFLECDRGKRMGLNSNKGTKCDIEICDSRALFGEFKCAASESWTPPASLPLGLPAGQWP